MDSTRSAGASDNTDLGSFLGRPVNIYRQTWSEGANYAVRVFDPWYLFLSHSAIKNKLETYKLIQGTLKVKFTINANGFSYGNMIVWYHPLQYEDVTAGYPTATNVIETPAPMPHGAISIANFPKADITRHSQKPHIFLLPQTSTGGTLELPFLWRENWLDLTTGDVEKMGKIFVYPLNDLKSLQNTLGATVSITAYAWMENARLSLATTQPIKFGVEPYGLRNSWPIEYPAYKQMAAAAKVAQAHAGDEYATGPVSKVANSVAVTASAMSRAPMIGPYARASSLVAEGVGRLASLFGYSRPTILTNVSPYKPIYLGNLANTDAGDSGQKLTLDSKQEVSIDPRVVGLPPNDEMTIRSIAGRESYWRSFQWGGATGSSSTTYSAGDRIMNCIVHPAMFNVSRNNGNVNRHRYNLTGCAYAVLPFNNWRGTMRYRFQIIASQFHRGRLRVVWDPNKILETKDDQGNNLCQNFDTANVTSAVIDLADSRDFVVDVGWGKATTYMANSIQPENLKIVDNDIFVGNGLSSHTVLNTTLLSKEANGVLGLYVVNDLVATHTTAGSTVIPEATINVFISCPDLDVVNPVERSLQNWTPVIPYGIPVQAPTAVAHAHAGFEENDVEHAPVSTTSDVMLGPPVPPLDSNISSVFFGDPVLSIRTLMKRYSYYMCLFVSHNFQEDDNNCVTANIYRLPDYPMTFGNSLKLKAPMYINMTGSTASGQQIFGFVPCKQNFMTFYAPAYACRRGGTRWKYMFKTRHTAPVNGNTRDLPPILTVARGVIPIADFRQEAMENPTGKMIEIPYEYRKVMPSGEGGSFVTNTDGNPVVEVELPFYTSYRFLTTKLHSSYNLDVPEDSRLAHDADSGGYHSVTALCAPNKNSGGPLVMYVAAADDFSLHMYLGPPLLYYIYNYDSIKQIHQYPYTLS